MSNFKSRKVSRQARHLRVRKKVSGTQLRPRMAISISNRNITVQFIDDQSMRTLASVSTLQAELPNGIEGASALGKLAAEKAVAAGIATAVVDRGGFKYHGRLKAIVESANRAGLAVGAVAQDVNDEESMTV